MFGVHTVISFSLQWSANNIHLATGQFVDIQHSQHYQKYFLKWALLYDFTVCLFLCMTKDSSDIEVHHNKAYSKSYLFFFFFVQYM